jgi:hypothetical protein
MSTMFGGGGGASPASWGLTKDILAKNQAEQDRLTAEGKRIDDMTGTALTSAKGLQDMAEQVRLLGIRNPNPMMTTGYTGVANYGGSRTLGAPYILGT